MEEDVLTDWEEPTMEPTMEEPTTSQREGEEDEPPPQWSGESSQNASGHQRFTTEAAIRPARREKMVFNPALDADFDRALYYVYMIKDRFQDDGHVTYNALWKLLVMYERGEKTRSEVHQGVQSLFADHEILIYGFECFMPRTTDGATSAHLRRDNATTKNVTTRVRLGQDNARNNLVTNIFDAVLGRDSSTPTNTDTEFNWQDFLNLEDWPDQSV